jgi:hypothetical protein
MTKELEKKQNIDTFLTIYKFFCICNRRTHKCLVILLPRGSKDNSFLEDVVNQYLINNYYYAVFTSTTPNTVTT